MHEALKMRENALHEHKEGKYDLCVSRVTILAEVICFWNVDFYESPQINLEDKFVP